MNQETQKPERLSVKTELMEKVIEYLTQQKLADVVELWAELRNDVKPINPKPVEQNNISDRGNELVDVKEAE